MKSLLAGLAVALAGVQALWWATDGLRAFTAEQARRLAVQEAPRALPPMRLEGQDGSTFTMDELAGRAVVVNFVYTRCPTVCNNLGDAMQRLQGRLPPGRLGEEVVLLSISFDPDRDTPRHLAGYGERFRSGPAWRLARTVDGDSLTGALRTFGVTVIADGYGGFEHNAALHVVDRGGRLAYITDLDDLAGVERVLEELL